MITRISRCSTAMITWSSVCSAVSHGERSLCQVARHTQGSPIAGKRGAGFGFFRNQSQNPISPGLPRA